MPRLIFPACCLLLLALTAARGEDAKPLAVFPMGPDRMPFVTLFFGGKDYQCLIDTGTSVTVLDEALRPLLGDPVGDDSGIPIYSLTGASIGSFVIPTDARVECRDLSAFAEDLGARVDGLIAMNLLSRTSLSLDFDEGVVALHEPDYMPEHRLGTASIECKPFPFTTLHAGGRDLRLAVDSGSTLEVGLNRALLDAFRENGAATVFGEAENARSALVRRIATLHQAEWNGLSHAGLYVDEYPSNRIHGVLGLAFLARYNPTFSFARNEVALVKSKWHDAHWWMSLRGMRIGDVGGQRVVFSVRAGSPAFRAGLRPGHEIDLPPEAAQCSELWDSDAPLNLRVRRSSTDAFEDLRLGPDTELAAPSATPPSRDDDERRPVASALKPNAARLLASFPLGPDRMPWVTLTVGDREYECLLDTGSQRTIISASRQPELGPPTGWEGSTGLYALPDARIGSLLIPGATVPCRDLNAMAHAVGRPMDGIVGMDILSEVALSLNFDEGVVTMHEPDYRPAGATETANLYCLPRPYAMLQANSQRVLTLVDSGSNAELHLRKDLLDDFCKRGNAIVLSKVTGMTAHGVRESRWGLLAEAGLLDDRPGQVQVWEWHNDRHQGVMGIQFLARYNSTLRFAQNELVLSKSKWHDAQFWPDLRGMIIAEVGGRRIVFSVKPGSTALRAGIRPDDEVDVPADFLKPLSPLFANEDSLTAIEANKYYLGWQTRPAVQVASRKPLWHTYGPLSLRIRKPGEAEFTTVQMEDDRSSRPLSGSDTPAEKVGRERAADSPSEPAH